MNQAKTGSREKIRATLVAGMNCCAQDWMVKAAAVLSKAVTRTAVTLVRNADLEGEVSRNPVVCSSYPAQRNMPTRAPAQTVAAFILRKCGRCNISSTVVATTMRRALNKRGEISLSAALICTKV